MELQQAAQNLSLADELAQKARYAESIKILLKIIPVFKKNKEWLLCIKSLNKIGDNYYGLTKFHSANHFFNESYLLGKKRLGKNHSETIESKANLGMSLAGVGEINTAIAMLNECHESLKSQGNEVLDLKIAITNNLALCYGEAGDYEKTASVALEALNLLEENSKEYSLVGAQLYHNIGWSCRQKGDRHNELLYNQKSLHIKIRLFGHHHPFVAQSYNNLGVYYGSLGDYDMELKYLRKSLAIQLKTYGNTHQDVAILYNNLGFCYNKKKAYDQQIKCLHRSLKIFQKLGIEDYKTANVIENLGITYGITGNFRMLLKHCLHALKIRLKAYGFKSSYVARSYFHLGSSSLERKEYGKSLKYLQLSLMANEGNFDDKNVHKNPGISKNANILLIETLALKVKAQAGLSRGEKDTSNLKRAVETARLALEGFDEIRKSYLSEESKLTLGDKVKQLCEASIEYIIDLAAAGNRENYREEIHWLSEKSKAITLLGAMKGIDASVHSKIPVPLRKREKLLKADLVYLDKKISEEKLKGKKAGHNLIRKWQENFFNAHQRYERHIKELERKYADYYRLKYDNTIASVSELKSDLSEDEALIEYSTGNEFIYIFIITNKSFNIEIIPKPADFRQIIQQLLNAINHFERKDYIQNAFRLYSMLFQPVEKYLGGKRRIIIIPEEELFYLPFDTLLTSEMDKARYAELPYLLRQYELSYHYSSTLWLRSRQRQSLKRNKGGFLGAAPSLTETVEIEGQTYPALSHSKKEVKTIASIFENAGIASRLMTDETATSSDFVSRCNSFRFIVIAAHQVISAQQPSLSGLMFSALSQSSAKFEILTIGETYNLELNADLVVLNCCETGIGKLAKGEGMMALNRGFLYAGARNIIYTLFKIPDNSAGVLTKSLFTRILSGKSYSKALQEAKLELIARPEFTPKAWAGYVMIGG